MRKVSLTIVAVLFALSGIAQAGETCNKSECEVAQKVSKLLASWQAIAEAEKSGCPEERAKLNASYATTAKECPIGSRLGATLGFVRSVLDTAVKADETCAKACPAAKGVETTAAATAPKPECQALMEARGKLLKDLQQLASFAANASPPIGCEKACAKEGAPTAAAPAATSTLATAKGSLCEKKAAEVTASVRKDACEKNAAQILMKEVAGLSCPEKAQKLATAIRAESCEVAATALLVKAATECCAKEGAATAAAPAATSTLATAKGSFCEKKAAEVTASVRKDACEKNAAQILMKEVAGLSCPEKAQKLATAIRAESCEVAATALLVKAATECCAKEGAATVQTAAAPEAKSGNCCADLLACAKTLKTSWDKVGAELTAMCPQKKNELQTAFKSLQEKSKAVALLPETVMALAQGVAALDGLNAKMVETAKANPDLLKSIPEEARKAFEGQCALIHEASEVLTRATGAFKGGCEGSAEKKTETTTSAD